MVDRTLSDAERVELLSAARAAVIARVTGQFYSPPPMRASDRRAGAFVTLREGDRLRGCIGHIGDDRLLADVVARCAAAAATEDPRFPPLSLAELDRVTIEISVLRPAEPFTDPAEIVVGRHGVMVDDGLHRGLLLPQVAVEWGWDALTFLSQTCVKAGLAPEAWKAGARLYRFEAEVFGEL